MLFGSIGFVAIGVFMARTGQWRGWLVIAFFGLGIAVFTCQLLPNSSYLRLGPDGITVCQMFRVHSYRWSDMGPFRIERLGRRKMIVFDFSPRYRGPRRWARMHASWFGAEAAICAADTWTVGMDELVDLLNRYRARYGAV